MNGQLFTFDKLKTDFMLLNYFFNEITIVVLLTADSSLQIFYKTWSIQKGLDFSKVSYKCKSGQ